MKKLIATLIMMTAPALSATASVTVEDSRAKSDGIVELTLTGGKGSSAEKLYKALTKVEEQGDDAMGGRRGTAKQGKAIDCSVENDAHVKNAYSCTIKVSTAGESLEPWK